MAVMMCTCSHDEEYPEDNWNLWQHIVLVEGLNTVGGDDDSVGVFKPHMRRQDAEPFVLSDVDEELILKVWFAAPVNIKRICVASCGGEDPQSHPSSVRCFTGTPAENLSFDNLEEAVPGQTIQLAIDPQADAFTHCTLRPFTQITFLLLHFPGNHGGLPQTRVSYIGLQGEHSHAKRQAVDAKYEAVPNKDDAQAALQGHGAVKQGQLNLGANG